MKHLLSPINIGTLELKNRVIMPAMGTCMPTVAGYVSKQLINYHVARAKGGCALNIVEVCSVHETAKRPEFLSIHEDKYIDGLLDLTTAIHGSGEHLYPMSQANTKPLHLQIFHPVYLKNIKWLEV